MGVLRPAHGVTVTSIVFTYFEEIDVIERRAFSFWFLLNSLIILLSRPFEAIFENQSLALLAQIHCSTPPFAEFTYPNTHIYHNEDTPRQS